MRAGGQVAQPCFAELTIAVDPAVQRADTDAQLTGDRVAGKPFFKEELDGSFLKLQRKPIGGFGSARNPPRGVGVLLLYFTSFILHGNTPFIDRVSTIIPFRLVS